MGLVWLAEILTLALLVILLASRPFTKDYTVRLDDDDEDGRARDES